eukprot:2541072-Rhodomonas_salina.1
MVENYLEKISALLNDRHHVFKSVYFQRGCVQRVDFADRNLRDDARGVTGSVRGVHASVRGVHASVLEIAFFFCCACADSSKTRLKSRGGLQLHARRA